MTVSLRPLLHSMVDETVTRFQHRLVDGRNINADSSVKREQLDRVLREVINERLPVHTLTPVEQANAILVLYDEFGVDETYMVEGTRAQSLEQNVEQMFQDALTDTLRREATVKTGNMDGEDGTGDRVTRRTYARTPLATRLARMPEPTILIQFLASEAITLHQNRQWEPFKATAETIENHRDYLWELDPAQQVYLMVESARAFDGAYVESDQWPDVKYDGVEGVIGSGHLWHHIEGILRNGIETRAISRLSPQEQRRIDERLTLLGKQQNPSQPPVNRTITEFANSSEQHT